MVYQFTEDCMIGIKEIDEEHEGLFRLLNETLEQLERSGTSRDALKTLLERLHSYAETHFAHEEAYMEKIHDPELERQREEHEAFVNTIHDYEFYGLSEGKFEEQTNELLLFMAKWLYCHILGSDTMIGKSVKASAKADRFRFSDRYKTGIALIDEEHRHLFDIIKRTNDLVHAEFVHDKFDEIISILNELREYTEKHFADEERYMESIHYDGLANQRIAHETFINRLDELKPEQIDENQAETLQDLIDFLLTWLSAHILQMDKLIP